MSPVQKLLECSGVMIKDPVAVQEKLNVLRTDGMPSVQVIADFDMTLTTFMTNGKRGMSSHNTIESSGMLGAEHAAKATALVQKYYPIEIDHSIPLDRKAALMVEWWVGAHELLVEHGMRADYIPEMVHRANLAFRNGTLQLFQKLHMHDVPVLIFSAGVGDIIREALRQRLVELPNVHVISNFMTFDDRGFTTGFKGNLIHTFNKQDVVIKGTPFFETVKDRRNVILLGDGLGDLQMSKGMSPKTVLSVGFLNDRVEERKQAYLDAFDIVVLNDGPMDVVHAIVDAVC
eukprot:TRINITY_DN5655_c0_g2_i1.p1 TRINITY_DN5655_c0_g2~~TRINITY_DN5655_c0_g2_i1.p1  ORF type:complete len:289 (-),score=32.17 TRINITY_DN5655_c0_g2_i1:145-1011(-)